MMAKLDILLQGMELKKEIDREDANYETTYL